MTYFCGQYEFKTVSNFTYEVESLEGDMMAYNSDWIVKGVEGDVYVIKNNIFEKTHEYRINSSFAVNSDTAPFGVSAE
jgi:hypothetical protein